MPAGSVPVLLWLIVGNGKGRDVRPSAVASWLAATLAIAACATGPSRSTGITDAGPGPTARTPVLASCPSAGGPSSLPRVILPCLGHGPDVNTALLGGKPVLINLWASWCLPCQREMPALQAAYVRYGDQVTFLGVATKDDVNSANDFLAAVSVLYPEVVDDDGDLLHKVGGAGLPVTLVLDAGGRLVFSHRGELRGNNLRTALAAAGVSDPQS